MVQMVCPEAGPSGRGGRNATTKRVSRQVRDRLKRTLVSQLCTFADAVSIPSSDVGGWRFHAKTSDPELVRDLAAYCNSIASLDRADIKFTHKFLECTEKGRLQGWGWQKQSIQSL